jgi:hypothetical protein
MTSDWNRAMMMQRYYCSGTAQEVVERSYGFKYLPDNIAKSQNRLRSQR